MLTSHKVSFSELLLTLLFFLSGLGLLTGTRLEVLGLLLVELDEPGLHDDPLLVLPLPLLELDELARSLFELADFAFSLGC